LCFSSRWSLAVADVENPSLQTMRDTTKWIRIQPLTNNQNELAGNLMKMAQDIGEELSESEALALVNDAFSTEVFSHSAPTPDVSQDDLRKILGDWLERKS
jgi:hypothetical protein